MLLPHLHGSKDTDKAQKIQPMYLSSTFLTEPSHELSEGIAKERNLYHLLFHMLTTQVVMMSLVIKKISLRISKG
jgi:hypothetical protein